MKPATIRKLEPAAVLALCWLCAGCPDTASQLCPPGSKSVGSYTLALTFQPGNADECRVTSSVDGGPLDASLGTTPAPDNSALCVSSDDAGGATLYLAVEQPTGTSVKQGPLGDGGTFSFTGSTVSNTTACGCTLSITEIVSGQLQPPGGDGGVTYNPDAGLSPVGGLAGTVVDVLDGGAECRCGPRPCSLDYALTGTRQ